MSNPPTHFDIALPQWARDRVSDLPNVVAETDAQMELVLEWARLNVQHRTGGPFAAGVFTLAEGELIAVGVNRVIPCGLSSAHAEIVALSLAQRRVGQFDLAQVGSSGCRLVVSAQPCAMCFGAVLWSGVGSLVVAASAEQVQRITGFDEGPLHPEWRRELARRHIELHDNIRSEEAETILQQYVAQGQAIYNARR